MFQRWVWLIVLISATVLLAGNLILGTVVAPTLFRNLSTDHAGLGFGNILRLWSGTVAWPLVWICITGLGIIFIIRLRRGHSNWYTAAALLAMALGACHWWSDRLVNESITLRDYMRNTQPLRNTPQVSDSDSQAAALKKHFDYLHRSSTRAFLGESAVALLIIALASGGILVRILPPRTVLDDDHQLV